MASKWDEVCKNCKLSYGSHYGGIQSLSHNYCPGHEGRMNWDQGPGTVFKSTGTYKLVEYGTPANRRKLNDLSNN